MASALVSTLGAASVAEAVTATTSGSLKLGQEFDSPDSGTDTNSNISNTNFSVSLSETTDGGTTISSSFMLTTMTLILTLLMHLSLKQLSIETLMILRRCFNTVNV